MTEFSYDFLDNGAGDVMLVADASAGDPENPVFSFISEKQAVLRRRLDQILPIPYIPAKILKLLADSKTVLVTEMTAEDEIGAVYTAKTEKRTASDLSE